MNAINWQDAEAKIKRDASSLFFKGFYGEPKECYFPPDAGKDLNVMLLAGFGDKIADYLDKNPDTTDWAVKPFRENLQQISDIAQSIKETPDTEKARTLGQFMFEQRIATEKNLSDNNLDVIRSVIQLNIGVFNLITDFAISEARSLSLAV